MRHPLSRHAIARLVADLQGSVAIEYGLIAALVSMVLLLGMMAGIGESLVAIFGTAAEALALPD
jgi:Flp pilus assembly pilin Flp